MKQQDDHSLSHPPGGTWTRRFRSFYIWRTGRWTAQATPVGQVDNSSNPVSTPRTSSLANVQDVDVRLLTRLRCSKLEVQRLRLRDDLRDGLRVAEGARGSRGDEATTRRSVSLLQDWFAVTNLSWLHRKAQNEENNRLLLQRLSASIWIPVAEAPRPSAKDIRRAEREIRKRQEELERQLLYAIRGRVTWGFEASDWNEKRQRSVGGPSRPAGGVKRKLPIDEHAQPPVPTDEDPQTLTAAERMPWNSWATMPDTDDEHGSPEPPAKRICRRLENGDEVIEETVTLPGGYNGIEVEKLIKGPKPELCRKRDNPDYEEDGQDLETLRRVAEGRMVRRRVGKLAEAITTDPEMFVVERFVEIAAKYARYDVLGESTTDRLNIDSTEVTHISDGNADALKREDPSSTLEDEEDTGYFSADKEDNSDNESDEDTSPGLNAQAKGKMPAEGPRAQIAQSSNPATDVKPHENDSANLSSASASRSLRAPANAKIPATSSRKKTSAKNDLTTQAKARIINAVVLAAENRLGLSALAPRVPVQLDEGEWIDENGTRWKVVADGKKYQRVAVKEWRRKYYRVRILSKLSP